MQADFKIYPENGLPSLMLTMYEMDETPPQSQGGYHEQPDALQSQPPPTRHHLGQRLLQDIL